MRKILYGLNILILILITILAFQIAYQKQMIRFNGLYQFNITNLSEQNNFDQIVDDLENIISENKINIFTFGMENKKDESIPVIYSNFQNEDNLVRLFPLKSGSYPKSDEVVSFNNFSDSENVIGVVDLFVSPRSQLVLTDISRIKNQTYNRIYYVDGKSDVINEICKLLNINNIDYSVEQIDNKFIINKLLVLLILYLLVCILLIELFSYKQKANYWKILSLNGFGKLEIIFETMRQTKLNKWFYILYISATFLVITILTENLIYSIISILIFLIIYLLAFCLLMIAKTICLYGFISSALRNMNKQNSDRTLVICMFIVKYMSIFVVLLMLPAVHNKFDDIKKLKSEVIKYQNLNDYYVTSYQNDTADPYAHPDFDTMTLTNADELSKQFIDKTEDELGGIVFDDEAYNGVISGTCDDGYYLQCNVLGINQNYLDLEQVKDVNGQLIDMDNDKLDIIIPADQKDETKKISESIIDDINTISPKFNYQLSDVLVHYVPSDYCYFSYDLNSDKCIDSVAIEYGDYYYNTSLLLAQGNYFFKVENTDVSLYMNSFLNNNEMNYHFMQFTPKTQTLYTKIKELSINALKIIAIIIFMIIELIIATLIINYLLIKYAIRNISIYRLQGMGICEIYKFNILINILFLTIIFVIVSQLIVIKLSTFIAIFIFDIFTYISSLYILTNKYTTDYIKGRND